MFLTADGRQREMENRAEFEDYITETIGALTEVDKLELTRIMDQVSGHIAGLLCVGAKEQEGRGCK